jgi:hypothetical protein
VAASKEFLNLKAAEILPPMLIKQNLMQMPHLNFPVTETEVEEEEPLGISPKP